MSICLKIIFFIIFILPFNLHGIDNCDLDYEFIKQDTFYSFRGILYVQGNADSLLSMIYDHTRIHEYTKGTKAIDLIQKGDNWYDLGFAYRYLLVTENYSIWRRKLNSEEMIVTFEMLSNDSKPDILPEIRTSSGYYKIFSLQDSCKIEVFQEFTLNKGLLNQLYFTTAEKEAVRFLKVFKEFLEGK